MPQLPAYESRIRPKAISRWPSARRGLQEALEAGGIVFIDETQHYPVPPDVVETHPQWGAYNDILVANEILIIDPGTREIVEIFRI